MSRNEWEFQLLLPKASPDSNGKPPRPDSAELHSLFSSLDSRIVRLKTDLLEQWEETLLGLQKFGSKLSAQASDWMVEEIEIGFALSASGELLFIADVGAQASIKVKMRRKPSKTDDC